MSFFELQINNTASFLFDWHPRFTEDGVDVVLQRDGERPLLVASDSLYYDIVPTALYVIDYVCQSDKVPFSIPKNGLGYLFYLETRQVETIENTFHTDGYHLFTTPCCDGPQETWLYPYNGRFVLEISTYTRIFKRYRVLYRTSLLKSDLMQWRKQIEQFT